MKKGLKWFFIIVGGIIVLFVAAATILPVVFKDDIKAAIDKELANSVNADVIFDVDDFSLSLFTNFPNITAEMRNFGVMNREPFAGEMLFATEKLQVEVNLRDILFGDQLRVKGISLIRPVINIKVLKDGRANYDIAVPSSDTTATTETGESGDFSFGIDHWEVVDADITYDDQSMPMYLSIKGMNHSGSGDFTQDVFDLKTLTRVDSLTTSYDGVEYLSNKQVKIDATIAISEEYSKYTFKENTAQVNDFVLQFDGWFKMNENDFGMDISFNSPDNSFKSLLSLVPGVYTEGFDRIETSGDLSFNGSVKGTYSDNQMPAFNVNLLVKDASFKYPDLPTPVNNINVDLLVDNKDGNINNTVIDLKKLHLDFGSNPVNGRMLISGLSPADVDADISARLNLQELNKMFPMEGLEMKGSYSVNVKAKGVYDSLKKRIPAIDAVMVLKDGYVKSADFPLPLDDMHFTSSIKNTSGKMEETVIRVNDFSMLMDGEKFTADLILQNLNDYTWDLKANGSIDLEKITRIFPIEGMTLSGKVTADIQTKGKYSDLEAERYDRLPTSGTTTLKKFKYITADLPEVTISEASMSFDPRKISLQKLNGTIGKSDFSVNGSLSNYLGYVLGKNEVIQGNVNFGSSLLDLNEFMPEGEESATTEEDTSSFSVIPIPHNVDFVLHSRINTVKLMDMNITNAAGDVIIRDGKADLSGLRFNMLGGSFVVNGTYDTRDLAHPRYDFALKIENMSMQEAANASSLVRTYAPIAGMVNGKFSTDFKIGGELQQDMMPDLKTVNGDGLIKIAQAALTGSKLISGVTAITKLNDTDKVTMKDVLMSAIIKNGRLSVKPFDVSFGSYKTTVSGSTGLDGSISYSLNMDVPAGKLGTEMNSLIAQYTGGKTDPNSKIPLTIQIGGTYNDPQPKLVMDQQKAQAKEAISNVVKEEGTKALEKAVEGTEAEKLLKGILGKGDNKDSTANKSNQTGEATSPGVNTEDLKKKVEEEAKQKIQNLLKKKKN